MCLLFCRQIESIMVVAEGQPQTAASNTPVYDVVFVVEAAAALCGYFDSVKTNYILPALE